MPAGSEAARNLGQIPVIGIGAGGPDGHYEWNGEEVDRVDRPPLLANAVGAYAIHVTGTSMIPRYEEGELLFIHPGRPIVPGCYVVVQFHIDDAEGSPRVWVKQFLKRTPKETTFKQLNPAKELKIPTERIVAVHRIVGTNER
jgi:phage repressor protein C with HTH and peptisase S24 domain